VNQLQTQIMPPQRDARFAPLLAMTQENWREMNPQMVKGLENSGKLGQVLTSALEQAIVILQQAEVQGLSPDQGRELAYEDLLQPDPDDLRERTISVINDQLVRPGSMVSKVCKLPWRATTLGARPGCSVRSLIFSKFGPRNH